jgi:F-type H+-transporting ATPase subunit alpha
MGTTGKSILDAIMSKKALDDEITKNLTAAINDYKTGFKAGLNETKPVMATA